MLKSSEFGIFYQKVDELWAFSPSIESVCRKILCAMDSIRILMRRLLCRFARREIV